MPRPVRLAAESANIWLSITPNVCIRHWTIKHRQRSILRKEHHSLITSRFFCLDKGVHLIDGLVLAQFIAKFGKVLMAKTFLQTHSSGGLNIWASGLNIWAKMAQL